MLKDIMEIIKANTLQIKDKGSFKRCFDVSPISRVIIYCEKDGRDIVYTLIAESQKSYHACQHTSITMLQVSLENALERFTEPIAEVKRCR